MIYFRALLVTLVICLPQLISLIIDGNNSTKVFNVEDLSYYLLVLQNFTNSSLSDVINNTLNNAPLTSPQLVFPHFLYLVTLSRVVSLLNFTPSELAVFLDLICVFSAYLLFTKTLSELFNDKHIGEITTGFIIGFPVIGNLVYTLNPNAVLFSLDDFYIVSSKLALSLSNLPITRELFTQTSFVLLGLIGMVSTYYAKFCNYKILYTLGLLSALQVYIYFYGWVISFLAIVILLIYTHGFKSLRKITLFTVIFSFFSLPGLYILIFPNKLLVNQIQLPLNITKVIYFPVCSVLIILIILFFLRLKLSSIQKKSLSLLAIVLLISFICHNLQLLTKTHIQSFHFSYFYTMPVLSGVIIALAVRQRYFHIYFTALYTLVLALCFLSSARSYNISLGFNDYYNRLKKMQSAITSNHLLDEFDKILMVGEPYQLVTASILTLTTNKKINILEPYDSVIHTAKISKDNFYRINFVLKHPRTHIVKDQLKLKEFDLPLIFSTMEFLFIKFADINYLYFNNFINHPNKEDLIIPENRHQPFYIIMNLVKKPLVEDDFRVPVETVWQDKDMGMAIFLVRP